MHRRFCPLQGKCGRAPISEKNTAKMQLGVAIVAYQKREAMFIDGGWPKETRGVEFPGCGDARLRGRVCCEAKASTELKLLPTAGRMTSDEKAIKHRTLTNSRWSGISQMTLVEHSLCPLQPPSGPFVHTPRFEFFEGKRKRSATATIDCRRGLRPEDDAYLWALLANALREPEPQLVTYVGVRYLLRSVGLSSSGRSTELLRQILFRLGGVRYSNDHFYDPVKQERRSVDFSFLSTDIPRNTDSFRPWRIAWDPLFFEFVQAWGGFLGFDLPMYRCLRPATGRLFLYLKKLLYKRKVTHYIDVRSLATNTLGFAETLKNGVRNSKVRECAKELARHGIISLEEPSTLIESIGTGQGKTYRCRFYRGPAFDCSRNNSVSVDEAGGPTFDLLLQVGLEVNVAAKMLRDFPVGMLNKWADVTLAAKEAGAGFKKGPEAFFVANVKADARDGRPLPEWYHRLRKQEELAEWDKVAKEFSAARRCNEDPGGECSADGFAAYLRSDEGRAQYEELVREVFPHDPQQALSHMRRQFDESAKGAAASGDGLTPLGRILRNR